MPTVAPDLPDARRFRLAAPPRLAFLVVTALLFALSGGMLWVLGLNYDGLTGSPASKVHPATYGACLLILWQMAASGNPVSYAAAVARTWPASVLFLAASLVLFATIVAGGSHNMSGTIDTFMLPVFFVVLSTGLDPAGRRNLEALIHAVMITNAVMGLVEFMIDTRFFPFVIDGQAFATDTRSTALGGHPLANATFTACYVLVLLSGAGVLLGARMRALVVLLSLGAMVTFGGRSAIVVTLVLGPFMLARQALHFVRRGRMSLVTAAVLVLAVPSLLGAGAELAAIGFFTPLLDRFESDGGSAEARVLMLDLLNQVQGRDLLVGPDQAYIDAIRLTAGLEQGIENPIVAFILYRGVLITLMMLVTFALFMREVAHRCARGTLVPILGFLLLVNTFESLAGKGVIVAKFMLMLVVFYPQRGSSADAARASR